MLVLLVACVIDRTGQSATHAYEQQLADHGTRIREQESVAEDVGRRIGQLEEVTRARGQEEILKMETMEQLRGEVANMRGDLELLGRDYKDYENSSLGFQTDVDGRLLYLETRVANLEKAVGIKPPPMVTAVATTTTPAPTSEPGVTSATGTDASTTTSTAAPAQTPDEYFGLITQHLQEGSNEAARVVAERFIAENPKHDRVAEAWYRISESYQNGGDFKNAATSFQVVVEKYPTSTWAPWSMLRQGECFEGLGKADVAKTFYCDVIRVYPKSKAAKEAKPKCGG